MKPNYNVAFHIGIKSGKMQFCFKSYTGIKVLFTVFNPEIKSGVGFNFYLFELGWCNVKLVDVGIALFTLHNKREQIQLPILTQEEFKQFIETDYNGNPHN